MTNAKRLDFPIEKAKYLLTRVAKPGEGGDKQNFWKSDMGFESPEAIRDIILSLVSLDLLQFQDQNNYGERYRAYIEIVGPAGISRRIRTVWIIIFNEDVARFVTAVPDKKGGLKP
jgi:hypothetical protein